MENFRTSILSRRWNSGFTLIELLIVIAIILILIAIALPNFLEAQTRARVTRAKADLRTVGIAMEAYFTQFNMYPPDHDPDDLCPACGLFYLTTPIQFITELPNDVFNQGGSGVNQGEIGHEMASTSLAIAVNAPPGTKVPPPQIRTYFVWSRGPNPEREHFFGSNDGWPFAMGSVNPNPCPEIHGYMTYAPTNGTKSDGLIPQTGGEWKSGNYCIDGWQVIRGRFPVLTNI